MYNILILLIKLFLTNSPQNKIKIELQLMYIFNKKNRILRKYFQRRLYYVYHCDISEVSKIDVSVEFIHPIAVVIGSKVVVEKNCYIYQNVTIGSNFNDNKMPYIKQGTKISAGAKLIGNITIGQNCIVGANAVITKSVPDNTVVYGFNNMKENKYV